MAHDKSASVDESKKRPASDGQADDSNSRNKWQRPPPSATFELKEDEKPPLNTVINSYDFEEIASRTLSKKTWAFYSSAATDCITREANRTAFDRIWWRPRVLRNVGSVDTRSRMLGYNVSMPLFIAPAGLAGLVHSDGEGAMAAACAEKGIIQCVSSNASMDITEIVSAAPKGQPFFFQLYVNTDRAKTEALLKKVKSVGIRAIFLTVDTPKPGKREADERVMNDESLSSGMSGSSAKNDKRGGGLGRSVGSFIDPSLSWDDLKWLRGLTDLPIILKGIQGAADARLAMQYGAQGIVVSNHGGRNLDTAPAPILVLLELQRCCPEIFDHMEVYVDSGIRRGTDILKCLCLGATAVGMGRHFLYSLNYGQEGVEHLIDSEFSTINQDVYIVGFDTCWY